MSDLLDRVRRAGGGARPDWTPERAAANEVALRRLGTRRTVVRRAVLATTLVGALVGIFAFRPVRPTGGAIAEIVRYDDGTTATPTTPQSTLKIASATPSLVTTELERGGYRFAVVHDPRRKFRVRAGNVQVEVLGTEFTVERTGERTGDEHVRVAVHSGRVVVVSDSRTSELGMGEVGVFPRSVPEPAPTEAPAPSEALGAEPEPAPAEAPHPAPIAKRNWVHLAQAGDYDGAYAALQHTKETAKGPLELMLAADAARLSHHPKDAVAPLESVTTKFPHDPRAPLAAFTLGRILLDDLGRPTDAATAFTRARALAPTGPLVEDALAREVEAWYRAGDLPRAHMLADDYTTKYPKGTHARAVRRFGGGE